jgi:uncharacterized protein
MKASRFIWPIIHMVLLLTLGSGTAQPAELDHLYRAQAVVTGRGEANRAIGFALCLKDVLVKLSGDPRLIGDARVAALVKTAGQSVSRFEYRDRLSGVPIHDEQGSYDRPHDLTVDFDPVKIDAILERLGREPWLSKRPHVIVFLDVRPRKGTAFTLASDSNGARDADMRFSLSAAAERVGMPVALPSRADLATTGSAAADSPAMLAKGGEEVALAGTLTWSGEAHGWIADWRMETSGKAFRWQIRGVGFDDAFRNGLRGATQISSGNGQPG